MAEFNIEDLRIAALVKEYSRFRKAFTMGVEAYLQGSPERKARDVALAQYQAHTKKIRAGEYDDKFIQNGRRASISGPTYKKFVKLPKKTPTFEELGEAANKYAKTIEKNKKQKQITGGVITSGVYANPVLPTL